MGLITLIKILIALWSVGLIGAGVMADNPQLLASSRGTWFGVNMIQIGIWGFVGVLVWHYWSKAPAGSTFGQRIKFVIQMLLSWPKRLWELVKELWAGAPTS